MTYTPDQELRILTLWQPWASLMAWGEKQNETRSWPTRYRGWVAIHASARKCALVDCANESWLTRAMITHGHADKHSVTPWTLPTGQLLAIVWFRWCLPSTHRSAPKEGEKEHQFGDYTAGRYFYATNCLHTLPRPIAWKGGQGLRRAPESLCREIANQLEAARK